MKEDKHFQLYIDQTSTNYSKKDLKEYLSWLSNSGVHALMIEAGLSVLNSMYVLSVEIPNHISIRKKYCKYLKMYYGCGLVYKDSDTLFICGGREGYYNTMKDCYEYSFAKDELTKLPDMITPRSEFGIFYKKGRIYVMGGLFCDEDEIGDDVIGLKNCEYFDCTSKKWTKIADLNRTQVGGTVFNYRDELWLIGYMFEANSNYKIERYVESKDTWEICELKLSMIFCKLNVLLATCENEILIFLKDVYNNRLYKLNLMDHTFTPVLEFGKREKYPEEVFPIDESKILVMYSNFHREGGFALYDVNKGILFDHCLSSIRDCIPSDFSSWLVQRAVNVPYAHTPRPPTVARDYSAINLIFGSIENPFQLEINSLTGEIELCPVRTDMVLDQGDNICRISDNELFIFRSEDAMDPEMSTKQAVIYNLNTRTYKELPDPLISFTSSLMCYFKRCVYIVDNTVPYNGVNHQKRTLRYDLVAGEWELTGNINVHEHIHRLLQCQSNLFAVRNGKNGESTCVLVFNERRKRWGFCYPPSLGFMVDVSSEYYSHNLLLYREQFKKNVFYWYNICGGDLAMPPSLMAEQRGMKYVMGVIRIAGVYIKVGTTDQYSDLELQCLDPRGDEEIAARGLQHIDWAGFKRNFNKIANAFVPRHEVYRYYVFSNHNRKEIDH